jgi:hypothetical protein
MLVIECLQVVAESHVFAKRRAITSVSAKLIPLQSSATSCNWNAHRQRNMANERGEPALCIAAMLRIIFSHKVCGRQRHCPYSIVVTNERYR